MSRNETIRARTAYVASRLESAARELLRRGVYAAAARIAVPGLGEPIRVAVGSVDATGSAPLTGDELFAVASQSKMLTAACVLLLAREGAISLEDPVSKYVPDVPAVDGDATV